VVIGGRTKSKSKNLHFAPRPKRRTGLKVTAAVLVVVLLLVAAGVIKAAVAADPAVTARTTVPPTRSLPGTPPVPAWPASGQAAVAVEGLPPLGSLGSSTALPLASLAKIITALGVLQAHPLRAGQNGFTVTVGAADVADYRHRLAASESVVPVALGEQLSEAQLLQGLLVASGNNFAVILAEHDAGSVSAFVAKMQAAAQQLGMTHTTYTDPSGLLSSTVSTAGDQLVLAAKVMADPVFASTVALTSVTLPVAGQVANFNKAVGAGGYIGIKTGSDSNSGGCLVFANRQQAAGRSFTILGAVLGQKPGEENTTALIAAAVSAADALVHSIAPSVSVKTVVPAGTEVGVATNADGRKVSLVTSAPLTRLGYSGMAVPLSISIGDPGTSLRQGQTVGRIALGNGQSTTVVAAGSMPPVSFGWKLLHDY
jgi:D-alanyl-D-alanine carboxypeptidase (penicillin-binding protein 5/6)